MPNIRNCLKRELTISNFCFINEKSEAFYLPQWRWPHSLFLVYRIAVALYTIAAFVHFYIDIINPMVYLTAWSFLTLTLHCSLATVISAYYYCKIFTCKSKSVQPDVIENGHIADAMNNCVNYNKKDPSTPVTHETEQFGPDEEKLVKHPAPPEPSPEQKECTNNSIDPEEGLSYGCSLPGIHQSNVVIKDPKRNNADNLNKHSWFIKTSWLLFDISSVSSIMVSYLYFITIFHQTQSISYSNINVHIINSLIIIMEILISAYPVRLLHMVYPFLFGVIYIIFNVIYWTLDREKNVIYVNVVDWNFPHKTLQLLSFFFFILIPIQQCLNFAAYKLRLYIFLKIYKEKYRSG